MQNKRFLAVLVLGLLAVAAFAREPRNLCEKAFNAIPDKNEVFKAGAPNLPYPAYSDRAGWKALAGASSEMLIKNAEKYLNYKWQYIPPSLYLRYEKNRNRNFYKPLNDNGTALMGLVLGELVEGKGRFMSQIIDGVYYFATMPSWNGSGSDEKDGIRKRMIPNPDYHIIALTSAYRAPTMAAALYFFKDEFDKVDPIISKWVYRSLEEHIFKPYLDEYHFTHGHQWLGFNDNKVNNWNTYCNTFVTQCFLLADQDQDRLIRALAQSARAMDRYLDTNKFDGACDEGPSYWNMAGGKVYDYAMLMKQASGGKLDILHDEQVLRIMEWKSKNYITDGWVVPFGDGCARADGNPALMYRLGVEVGSKEMADYGIYLAADPVKKEFSQKPFLGSDIVRVLEFLRYQSQMEKAEQQALADAGGDWEAMMADLRASATSIWYPETEHAYLRAGKGWFIGVKGGNNAESHNHNDVGSGVFFIENCPVLIDAGVGTYGSDTFGEKRYESGFHFNSDWHNLPDINGERQKNGPSFKASGSQCDPESCVFSTDIAGAYPKEAAARKWHRTWALKTGELTITDRFELTATKAPNVEHFITWGKVYLPGQSVDGHKVKDGEALIAAHSFDGKNTILVKLSYPKKMKASVETQALTDKRFTKIWGKEIYRLNLTDGSPAKTGEYVFKFTRL